MFKLKFSLTQIARLLKQTPRQIALLTITTLFVAILAGTSIAQTSETPLRAPANDEPTLTISQSEADELVFNTEKLIAARRVIAAQAAEIEAKDKRDADTQKVLETYQRALKAFDSLIIAFEKAGADKDKVIAAQTKLIETLQENKKPASPLKAIINILTGVVLGKVIK